MWSSSPPEYISGGCLGFSATSMKLKRQEAALKDFCNQTGIKYDSPRVQVQGFGRSVSQKAVWANKKGLTNGVGSGKIKVIEEHLQKQLPYIYNGEKNFIPTSTLLSSVTVIAGKGSEKTLRIEESLVKRYGGSVGEWRKCAGKVESEKYVFDVHWYEYKGVQYRMKLKFRKERS